MTECNGKCRRHAVDPDCPKHGRWEPTLGDYLPRETLDILAKGQREFFEGVERLREEEQ